MDETTIEGIVHVPEHIADWLVDLLVETAEQNEVDVGGGMVFKQEGCDFAFGLSGDPDKIHSMGDRFLNLVDALNEFRQIT